MKRQIDEGMFVQLLMPPFCSGTVEQVRKDGVVVVRCSRPEGMVHVAMENVKEKKGGVNVR